MVVFKVGYVDYVSEDEGEVVTGRGLYGTSTGTVRVGFEHHFCLLPTFPFTQ